MDNEQILSPALQARADEAEHLARSGNGHLAEKIFAEILAFHPKYSRALNFMAMRALAAGDHKQAQLLIERACAGTPKLALIEANRGLILRQKGLEPQALAAFLCALELDPEFLPAHYEAGQLLEVLGNSREANTHFRKALQRTPAELANHPSWTARVAHARQSVESERSDLALAIETKLAPVRATLTADEQVRFDECLAIYHGRKKPMLPKPGLTYFPKLPVSTFFSRDQFDWVQRAEASTEAIAAELGTLLTLTNQGFIPYVQKPSSEVAAGSTWSALNHSPDWGIYFLFNQGQPVEAHCAQCPITAALLRSLPLAQVPQRAPTAFFSRLKAGAHIPAHHGATNTRLICHLPLIVPPNCRFRVGNDQKEWKKGEILIFDDTIEHEAWNNSDQDRYVLIFDIWHPQLTQPERTLVSEMMSALAEYYPGQQHHTDA
jgi:aspartate beta-hydroxylase